MVTGYLSICTVLSICTAAPIVSWKACLRQEPPWYGTAEAIRIADNVLLLQRHSGGWPKNIEMARLLSDAERDETLGQKSRRDSTIDNGATHTQLVYLARVDQAAQLPRHREAFLRGLDYLLDAQYDNGGWPQYFPLRTDYSRHITFNDGAMIGVLQLLHDVAGARTAYAFVDPPRRARAEQAVRRGIDCILQCQIRVNGQLTAWCAQHDERTLKPADARSYEKASLSGGESVGIVRFLMEIEPPTPAVVEAIEGAVAWLERAKLSSIRQQQISDSALPEGRDRIIVPDANAEPLWARFYEIGTNRPIFCGRDGIVKYQLAEIEHERRNGYAWYTDAPADLLQRDYPAWQRKWGRD